MCTQKHVHSKFHLSTPFLNPWDEFNEQHWRRTLSITRLYPEEMLTKNTSILFYLQPRIEVASYADILRACNAIFLPQRRKERLCDQPKVRLVKRLQARGRVPTFIPTKAS